MANQIACPKCGGFNVTTNARAINSEGARVRDSKVAWIVGGTLYVLTSVGAGTFITFVVAILIVSKITGAQAFDEGTSQTILAVSLLGGLVLCGLLYFRGDKKWRAVATVYIYVCSSCHHHWEVTVGKTPTSASTIGANVRRD